LVVILGPVPDIVFSELDQCNKA